MSKQIVEGLRRFKDVIFRAGLASSTIAKVQKEKAISFPPSFVSVLEASNGMETFGGYFRLFGLCTTECIDACVWNETDYWKFAWQGRCSAYWCFGETGWGDQYAFDRAALNGAECRVYFLDALSMTSEVIASSFSEFFEKEFIRCAEEPYDVVIRKARQKLGQLEPDSHLVYVPSILLGGSEDIANVQKMNARAAMVCNGDIAVQLDAVPSQAVIKGVHPYMDESRRMRFKLEWSS